MAKAKGSKKKTVRTGNVAKRASVPIDDGGALVRRLLAKYLAPSALETRAFTKQCSAATAASLGGRTRAVNVLHDAERFAAAIPPSLAAPKGRLAYGAPRFRFFLGLVDSLRTAIDKDRGALAETGALKDGAASARREAMAARELLIECLSAFAEGNAAREGRLSKALLDTKTDDLVLASLLDLAKVARTWLAGKSEEDRALAKSVGLDDELIAEADAARTKLAGAHDERLGAGAKVIRDSATTNALEGRVLFEMRYAMRLFDGAHARDARVPRLVPTAGTRQVLVPRGATKAVKSETTTGMKAVG